VLKDAFTTAILRSTEMIMNDELITIRKEAVVIPVTPVLELIRRNPRIPLTYTSRFSEYAV
jgi:hypothetical protein